MWTKFNSAGSLTLLSVIQILVILQISYGKPTEDLSHNSTDSLEIDKDIEPEVKNSSALLQTVSVLLTVLSPNETTTTTPTTTTTVSSNSNPNSTTEPDYDEDNSTTSYLSEFGDDFNSSSSPFRSSTESSSSSSDPSLLPSLITDGMEVAGSLDESVTAAAARKMVREDSGVVSSSSTSSYSTDDDDSIIIASMGSSLNQDTVQLPFSQVTTEAIEEKWSSSSDSSSSSSSSQSYSFSEPNPVSTEE